MVFTKGRIIRFQERVQCISDNIDDHFMLEPMTESEREGDRGQAMISVQSQLSGVIDTLEEVLES